MSVRLAKEIETGGAMSLSTSRFPLPSAAVSGAVRHDWTREEIRALFDLPLADLMFHAQRIHRENFDPR